MYRCPACSHPTLSFWQKQFLRPLRKLAGSLCVSVATWVPGPSFAAGLGELPGTPMARATFAGVQAEICQDHWFDPASITQKLPTGYRFKTLRERAESSTRDAAVLRLHPGWATFAPGTLCFVKLDSFLVDGKAVSTSPVVMAFWWGSIAPIGRRLDDDRIRGSLSQVQLAAWYARNGVDRALVTAIDPMAQYIDIRVDAVSERRWNVLLELENGRIEGEVQGRGDRKMNNPGPEPKYMTVLSSGSYFDHFTVYTYFGHHSESAAATWRSTGTAAIAVAAAHSGPELGSSAVIQDGWQALAGLYRSSR